jgi:protein-S-isoprenylcysteine O-methyltransferase Ste14
MMESPSLWQIEMVPWYALGLYWGISAFRVKTTKATEPMAARLYTACLAGVAFALLFSGHTRVGRLGERFLVRDAWLEAAGLALTYAGAAFAIWARRSLGGNWSAEVSLKTDHQLIRSGPYAYVRHPIYGGLLLTVIGTAVVIGEWRGLLAILIVAVAHALKAKREEAIMVATFGDRYQRHRRETGFLLPRL